MDVETHSWPGPATGKLSRRLAHAESVPRRARSPIGAQTVPPCQHPLITLEGKPHVNRPVDHSGVDFLPGRPAWMVGERREPVSTGATRPLRNIDRETVAFERLRHLLSRSDAASDEGPGVGEPMKSWT